MRPFKSIRWRVISCTAICVAVVGIASNLYIYKYLNGIISEKMYHIDELNRQSISRQLNSRLSDATSLTLQCANFSLLQSMADQRHFYRNNYPSSFLTAQQIMGNAISASRMHPYLNKMFLYDRDSLLIEANEQNHYGRLSDRSELISKPYYDQLLHSSLSGGRLQLVPSSLSDSESSVPCFVSLQPVTRGPARDTNAWLYTEFSLQLVTDILDDYLPSGVYFLAGPNDVILPSNLSLADFSDIALDELRNNDTFVLDGDTWRAVSSPLADFPEMQLFSCVNESALLLDNQKVFHTVLVVLAGSLAAGLIITILMSHMLTKPILRLTERIRQISENDFSFDPSIEKGSDEIASIGRVVNEMTLSVQHLLNETQSQAEQKRKIELAMLQSQVNPHFLYNTLDSIQWMAVIQKNPGIQQMARSLSNLLKHMAKGYNHKIPLTEELNLLNDYLGIMSIRYMDTFDFVNDIPEKFFSYQIIKLTLQPLVENAIFHGIEPTGRFGTIHLYAEEDGNDLLITVEDDGQGMDEATIHRVLTQHPQTNHSAMNGIGVSNVNERLRLVYGEGYGLTVQSEVGKYTRMTVRIPKEETK